MKLLLRLLVIAALGVGGFVAYMALHEEEYIFFPEAEVAQSPRSVGLAFRGVHFTTADGVKLQGWYMPHAHARYTLLHLHGNAGNIGDRLNQYRRWHDMGLAVFAFDYRGYGGSEGKPDEQGLYADAEAAWLLLTGPLTVPAGKIIIAGRSLGSAVAAHLARDKPAAGLVLEVPFTSIADMATAHYSWLPLGLVVRNRFDTAAALAEVKLPLLVISAASDKIIPGWMADKLCSVYSGPKQCRQLPGGHNDFGVVSLAPYMKTWVEWLRTLSGKESQQWVLNLEPRPSTSSGTKVRGTKGRQLATRAGA